MIDTHCHIDLYPDPHKIAQFSENNDIVTIGVTNLPSHFEKGFPHTRHYNKVRLALGMHPLYAERHKGEYEIFKKCVDKTSYIGEVGLDFSAEGIATKKIQIQSFKFILEQLKGKKKFITLHSRRAEQAVLELLKEYEIPLAVFHWYSGSLKILKQIIVSGYYLSVNLAMTRSENGQKIIASIPRHLMLTESDGPFVSTNGKNAEPKDVAQTIEYLSKKWNLSAVEVERQVKENFEKAIDVIRQ